MTEDLKEERAKETRLDLLHNLVTEKLISKLNSGEVTAQDIRAASDWLKTNGVDSPGVPGSPIDRLSTLLPDIDPSFIQERVNYGTKTLV